ncbi:hypothetical protein JL107_07340 [Nakamurella flavida]|uniref:Lipoprotein n=1 Tax=Nakamurella flavida TaxID=363630 RepID=A0A939C273_9ACTN|nr:hypothetical protein [Nakamurella flavida]MBM9476250.1 hypothetical protein [Nakamurella flavida]MDP9779652.1 hypothetical protein [Nakamurella flavida]
MSAAHVRRATTRGLLSVLAASTLFLAGCSQTVSGTATPDPNGSVAVSSSGGITTPSSSPAPSSSGASTGESATSPESSTDDGSTSEQSATSEESTAESSAATAPTTDGGGSSTVDPEVALDADTLGFFQAFCGGVNDAKQYASPSTAGQTLEEAQTTLVEAYSNIAGSAQVTAGILDSSPPPSFSGGDEFAKAASNQFLTLTDVYGRGADTIAALPEPTEQDLRDAVDAIEGEATAAQNAAPAFPPVPGDLEDAVRAVPECDGVF